MDTRIALTGAPTFNIQQAERDNAQTKQINEQTIKQHYDNLDAREKSRMTSVIAGAAQLKTFLDNEDIDGANNFLTSRKNSLMARLGAGENIDSQETDAAIQMLKEGRIDELKNNVNSLMAAGQIYGVINNKELPSNIVEWQYYNQMTPEDQKRFIQMKRQGQVINLGGSQIIADPTNPAGAPLKTFEVTPKPEEMPAFQEEQAEAKARGTGQGEAAVAAQSAVQKAGGLLASLEDLKTSSQAAPSGGISNVGATLANVSGVGGTSAQAQGDFQVKRAAAENAIRQAFRVVGSGATSDRDALPFIQMLPDANDSNDVKVAKTNAAMAAVKTTASAIAAQRGLPDPFAAEQNGQSSQNSGPIIVTNPQTGETLEIDAADLQAATAEGFVQQ